MPRLTPVHWKKLKCVFEKAGYKEDRQAGDHLIMVKPGALRPLVIPRKKNLYADIIISNLKSAGMSRDEYFKLLADC